MGIDVALIQPKFSTGEVRKLNICSPPIGLAFIAGFLRGHGHRVTIIDAEVEQLSDLILKMTRPCMKICGCFLRAIA